MNNDNIAGNVYRVTCRSHNLLLGGVPRSCFDSTCSDEPLGMFYIISSAIILKTKDLKLSPCIIPDCTGILYINPLFVSMYVELLEFNSLMTARKLIALVRQILL